MASPNLRSIDRPRIAGQLGEELLETARLCATDDKDLIAFAMVGLYADGTSFVGSHAAFPETMPVNRFMFIGMVTELIRDQMIGRNTARDIVNQANGFEPD